MTASARFARFLLVMLAVILALNALAIALHAATPPGALGIAAYPPTLLILRLMERRS